MSDLELPTTPVMNSRRVRGKRRQAHFAIIHIPNEQAERWITSWQSPEVVDAGAMNDLLAVLCDKAIAAALGEPYFCPFCRHRDTGAPIIQLHCDVFLLDEGSEFVLTRDNSPTTEAAFRHLEKHGMDTTACTLESSRILWASTTTSGRIIPDTRS